MDTQYDIDLGTYTMNVTTLSLEAKLWYDRGLIWLFGFNHEEAIRLFMKALECDSNFAMAHWGIAQGLIGNYNNEGGFDPDAAKVHIETALQMIDNVTDVERALIEGMVPRFVKEERGGKLGVRAYADAMRKVYELFHDDSDVAFVFSQAMMNIAPWQLWTKKTDDEPIRESIPETLEIIYVLENALQKTPGHPGLCHLYIHSMELGPSPEKALDVADRLRSLVLGSGHLVHMASHIDMWVGQYQFAIESNRTGIEADKQYVLVSGQETNFYSIYRIHCYHFLVWAAMFDGQYTVAIDHARKMNEMLNKEHLEKINQIFGLGQLILESFRPTKWHVFIRFGKWEDILNEPIPPRETFPTENATAHYARAIAQATLGNISEAEIEQAEFDIARKNPELDHMVLFNNSIPTILSVGESVLSGELEYRRGNYEAAFSHLREAVNKETALQYDEPWGWMMPTRHALGALLLEQNQVGEALSVFLSDLEKYPNNLWSLRGLLQAQILLNYPQEEIQATERLKLTAEERCESESTSACHCAASLTK